MMSTPFKLPPAQATTLVSPLDAEFGWSDMYLLVRRRLPLIFGCALLAGLVALPAIMAVPKLYYAETRVMLHPAPALDLASETQDGTPAVSTDTEIEHLLSYSVASAVIDRFDLDERPEFNAALTADSPVDTALGVVRGAIDTVLGTSAETDAEADTEQDTSEADGVRNAFRQSLAVIRQGTTNVLTVGFTSEDPVLATKVPAAVVEIYETQASATWESRIGAAMAWLDHRIETDRQRLTDSTRRLEAFRAETGGDAAGETADMAGVRVSLIESRLAEIMKERGEIGAAQKSLAATRDTPELAALGEPERLGELRRDLQQEMRELQKISAVYGVNYGAVAFRKSRIETIEADIATELKAYDHALALRDRALDAEETRLTGEIASIRERLDRQQRDAPELSRMTDSIRAQQDVVSRLEYRREILRSEAAVTPVALDVLVPASRPRTPIGISNKVRILGAVGAGLLLGLILAGLMELRDKSVRSPQQLTGLPRLVPVGILPRANGRQRRNIPKLLKSGEDDPVAGALKDAVFMLECANGGQLPSLLVVAPARKGDDAVPTAEWIAQAVAASGKPVWLVSTDARRPFVHASAKGDISRLSLAEEIERRGDLATALSVLEVLARQEGGMMIVDAPPLHSSRSLEIARLAGRVLLVMRWGRTPRPVVELIDGLLGRMGPIQTWSLIVDAKPRRHRLYGYRDRFSLVQMAGRHGA